MADKVMKTLTLPNKQGVEVQYEIQDEKARTDVTN